MAPRRVLLISGSLRHGSTNSAVLETVEPLDPAVTDLRAAIAAADAVLFSTPEYAGALPGSFKNLLDWTVGGGEIYDKPVAWVNVSTAPNAAVDAYESLRIVLRYAGTQIVDAAYAHIPVDRRGIGTNGLVDDPAVREQLSHVLTVLATAPEHDAGQQAGDQ